MRFLLSILVPLGLGTGCGVAFGSATSDLTVLAAPSLTEALNVLGGLYSHSHPGVTLTFTFESATDIETQVADRDEADVVAMAGIGPLSADVTDPRVFARAAMTIAVAPGDPHHIRSVAGLARPGLRVVLAGPDEPEGYDGWLLLKRAGVTVRPVEEEPDTRTVLTWVRTGQADAGIVFVPDMRWAGNAAASVPIPLAQNVTATFSAAAVTDGGDTGASAAFVAWLTSPAAQSVLVNDGFEPAAA
jgi:molybdate transport system substrate-binding protein